MKAKIVYLALALALVFSMVAVMVPANPVSAQDEIYFPDPILREAIRDAIGGGDITQSKLDLLSRFTYGGESRPDVTDLTGMEHCTSLTYLHLYFNWIIDIQPLSGLTSLTELRLTHNQISDIQPLSGLTNLQWLYLSENQISDIQPLSDLTSLSTLSIEVNQISDIEPLSGFTTLYILNLNDNQISDISPLVANAGLSDGDQLAIRCNPLNYDSLNIYIPELVWRGMYVTYGNEHCPTSSVSDGCFIATAAYGTSTAEEIDVLRTFRDNVLLESGLGSQLVEWYYQTSPPVADFISEYTLLKTLVRELLVDPIASLVEATESLWRH